MIAVTAIILGILSVGIWAEYSRSENEQEVNEANGEIYLPNTPLTNRHSESKISEPFTLERSGKRAS